MTPLDSADYTAKPDVHLLEGNYWREQIQVEKVAKKTLDQYSSLISTKKIQSIEKYLYIFIWRTRGSVTYDVSMA